MLVTITKSSGPKFWYAKFIGESFHVLTSIKGKHRIDISHYPDQKFLAGFFIDVEDCLPQKEDSITNIVNKDDIYSFSCIACDWIFESIVNQELPCPYCKNNIRTNFFNETDGG